MKRALIPLIIICFLGFIGWACGEEWNATKDNIESNKTTNDITETFHFPLDINKINVQSMAVEVEAYDVSFGTDYDETVWIYNISGGKEYLGNLPYGVVYKKFTIDDPIHYAYNSEIYLEFSTSRTKNVTIIFYNKNGSIYSESYNKKTKIHVDFPWSPENITKVEIIIRKKCGGDCVFIDGNYVGILNEGDGVTIFTISGREATNYLSDGSITVFIDKSNDYSDDYIQIKRITVRVFYTNKSGIGGAATKTLVPLGAVIIALMTIPIIVLKRLNS